MEMTGKKILHITRLIGVGGTETMIRQICELSRDQFGWIGLCAADGGGVDRLKGVIDAFYPIDDMQNHSPARMLKNLKAIDRIIAETDPDVIHVHHRMAAFYILLVNRKYHKPLVYTAHTSHDDKRFMTKRVLSKYPNIIAVGKGTYKNLTEYHGISPEQITMISNTVDIPKTDLLPAEDIVAEQEKGCFTVVNVGRLTEQKGQHIFVRAASVLKVKHPVRFLSAQLAISFLPFWM